MLLVEMICFVLSSRFRITLETDSACGETNHIFVAHSRASISSLLKIIGLLILYSL